MKYNGYCEICNRFVKKLFPVIHSIMNEIIIIDSCSRCLWNISTSHIITICTVCKYKTLLNRTIYLKSLYKLAAGLLVKSKKKEIVNFLIIEAEKQISENIHTPYIVDVSSCGKCKTLNKIKDEFMQVTKETITH